MSETVRLSNFASIANAVFNSVSANATAVTSMTVGGTTINATAFAGTANNATNLGGVAAASYALLAGPTFTGNTTAANLAFAAGARITGDFSNANVASRPIFQSNVTNGVTGVWAIPNGTGQISAFAVSSSSDPANASVGSFTQFTTDLRLSTTGTGSGTSTPMTLFTGGSERMRIAAAGNIGIGNSNPGSTLTIDGGGITEIRTGGYLMMRPAANDWDMRLQATSGNKLNVFSGGDLVNPIMTWVHGGNVGIGTSSPGAKFHISGVGAGLSNIRLTNTFTGGRTWEFNPYVSGVSDATFSIRDVTANETRLAIGADGNIGIGTTSPTRRLEIGLLGAFRMQTGSVAMDCTPTAGAVDSFVWNTSANAIYSWSHSGTERMRIDSAGRVTKPAQPGFNAAGETTVSVSISNYILALPTALTNRGSHYNTSTHRFTAPVTGMYMFAHKVTWASSGTGVAVHLSVNGSPFGGAAAYSETFGYSSAGGYSTTSASVSMVQLNANDFVDLRTVMYNSSAQSIDLTRSSFSGCLIG